MSYYIQKLIAQGEHQHLDFKFEISDARKMAKSFSAFANSGGGKLLIGVKDNGTIAGVRSEEEQYMVEAAASYYCEPAVAYTMRNLDADGKTVLEVDIPEGNRKPYYAKQKDAPAEAYIRVNDENIKASGVQIMAWKKQREPSGLLIVDAKAESKLLRYLEEHTYITFRSACKLLPASLKKTEQVLADLVYLNILEIEYSGGKVLFRAAEKN